MEHSAYESPQLKPEIVAFANLKLLHIQVLSAANEMAKLPRKKQGHREELFGMVRTLEGIVRSETGDARGLFEVYGRLHARLQEIVRTVWS